MLSHKDWRKNAKKMQRKRRRCLYAIKRNEQKQQQSLTYQVNEVVKFVQLQKIERMNEIEHEKWVESEIRIEKEWQVKKRRLDEIAEMKEVERKKMLDEYKSEQKLIAQAKEKKERLLEEKTRRQLDLKIRIRAYIEGMDDEPPLELLDTAETNPGKELCHFFLKTASCRFGNQCLRNHKRPKISKTLLIESFFTNIYFEQTAPTEYGNDITLECDDNEIYELYKEFFIDVLPEFENFGSIKYFVVCSNYQPHLRGSVLIEYIHDRDALRAQQFMNGRYYAGRMLNIEFRKILWWSAICGRSHRRVDL
ncbi:U2 small nuclear ribonucleoprotein auxiliary factor 35 kDa subunit-related protein 1 isoform X2 [Contarinia nasturtii]|uniref:U2 small nuclear ribonucleoprotein auxiliary factor 35 kDa subunit-related protein 1 isoform X2 n=1 Tax=Contarinia nasturtii TaxID=265458 RepID=UPI0012D38751|nr:U2 small nuclear ribonucleoprotein auxiliary factor 35 kDa subunit-related protein 1 isoform X2 [Contarinia nasturtii]